MNRVLSHAAFVLCVLVLPLAACGSEQLATTGSTAPDEWTPDITLPFDLIEVPGSAAVGRPAVFDRVLYEFNGEPIHGRVLFAMYRITGGDPLAVARAWAEQLDGLSLDRVHIHAPPEEASPWLEVTGMSEYQPDEARTDFANLQLWTTTSDPILIVSIHRARADRRTPEVDDGAGTPPPPEPVADEAVRAPGDVLFTEQGDTLHLPEGTRTLTPTIPVFGGTGGSASVLAADDGPAAVRALLDEAVVASEYEGARDPVVTEVDGVTIVDAGFVIPAGGWAFEAISVHAPGDPYATVYVTSSAD